ncbi:bifunctional nicotinamidase/pyrazinamidase [Terriglobus sp. RCC_193]|uniref:bifunctional nicotinamidase/pyrazinamidase n=1 Tax=Terriglobus sp. RCC_193 TaxID=3239218 RepID=UPI0035240E28
MANAALLVIDVQQDFLPKGSLAVPQGDEVIPIINRLGGKFAEIAMTQDWHPAGHISFASTHGKQPFTDTVEAAYGTQALWPDHTIQSTPGAELAAGLDLPHAGLILRKGFRLNIDSYSAFLENDHSTCTGLAGYFREKSITDLYLCGLAWDYCVGFSALDGKQLGFNITVITDAVRGIDPKSMAEMSRRWQEAGVRTVTSEALPGR